MRTVTVCAILAVVATAPAYANDDTHWYMGFDIGQANVDVDQRGLDSSVIDAFNAFGLDVLSGSSKVSDESLTYGLTFGYQPWKFLAFEVGYADFGRAEYKAQATLTDGTTTFDGNLKVSGDTRGPALSVLGILPVGDVWSLYGRAGVLFAHTNYDATATVAGESASAEDSDDTQEFLWGAGVGYTGGRWTTRVEYQQALDVGTNAGLGEADCTRITIGAIYRF